MITGSIVALVTPMHSDGSLDWECYTALIDWHVEQGSNALVVVGTTGESPTVTVEEHCQLIDVAVKHAAGRIPVIAGTGGNSTREAIELTSYAKTVGATASLSVVPYYNKPTQEGMVQHFQTIAETVDLPMILYNVPGRTVADMRNETVVRLAQVPGIIGIKDATGSLERGSELLQHTAQLPHPFAVYSGDDATALPLMLLGARGNISVSANVVPHAMRALCAAALKSDVAVANTINQSLLALHKALFVEANPIPVKWALQHMGRIHSGIRLPLTPLSASYHAQLDAALRTAGALRGIDK